MIGMLAEGRRSKVPWATRSRPTTYLHDDRGSERHKREYGGGINDDA